MKRSFQDKRKISVGVKSGGDGKRCKVDDRNDTAQQDDLEKEAEVLKLGLTGTINRGFSHDHGVLPSFLRDSLNREKRLTDVSE